MPTDTSTKTQEVGSHTMPVEFYGCEVPVGFLGSFRKDSHLPCLSGRGFVLLTHRGKRSNTLCECAVRRASKRLQQVGRTAFVELGSAWLAKARQDVLASEARCREEGRQAPPGSVNPYPANSDQHLSWAEGHRK